MLKLSTKNYQVYDVRTRVNPSSLSPYFARLESLSSRRFLYQHTYTFNLEKTKTIHVQLNTCMPITQSQFERPFLTIINAYLDIIQSAPSTPSTSPTSPTHQVVDDATIALTPLRITVHPSTPASMEPHLGANHSALLCISRENVTGAIYSTTEFKRELLPTELIVGNRPPSITPLEVYSPYIPDAHLDVILFQHIQNTQ